MHGEWKKSDDDWTLNRFIFTLAEVEILMSNFFRIQPLLNDPTTSTTKFLEMKDKHKLWQTDKRSNFSNRSNNISPLRILVMSGALLNVLLHYITLHLT